MKKIFVLALLLVLCNFVFAQLNSYKGYKWGTPYTEMADKLVPSTNKIPGFKAYDYKEGPSKFEGFSIHTETYGFKKDVLYGVNLGAYTKDKDALLALLTKKYGEPEVVESPFIVNYNWFLEETDIALTYMPMVEGDKSLSISFGRKK